MSKTIKKDKKKKKSYVVYDERIVYNISDSGLLHLLVGVQPNKLKKDCKVWFFKNVPDIREVVDRFYEDERRELVGNDKK